MSSSMSLDNKTVLVTGGAGFIGSHIVEYLLNNTNFQIRILDNLSTGTTNNIPSHPNCSFMFGDICDINKCVEATKEVSFIFHQAAIGSVPLSLEYPLKSHDSNVTGFVNILTAAKLNGVKRIVYASSSAVYGDNIDLFKSEDKCGKMLSPYAATKFIDEIYGDIYNRCFGLECIGLRYFNVYGPRQNINGAYAAVIPKFIFNALSNLPIYINGDGTISRDFVYVTDVVMANVLAMNTHNANCFGKVYNIGSGVQISLNQLYSKIYDLFNFNYNKIIGLPFHCTERAGDARYSCANITSAQNDLFWKPSVGLNDGLSKTIEYFLHCVTKCL